MTENKIFSSLPEGTGGEVTKKSPHPFLKESIGPKGPSIVPRMRELEEGGDEVELESKEINKGEIYALVGVVMKQVMKEVELVRKNKETSFIEAQRIIDDLCASLGYDGNTFFIPEGEMATEEQKVMVRENVWRLRHLIRYFVTDILNGDIGELDSNTKKVFARLDTLTRDHKEKWGRGYAAEYGNAHKLILSGLGTASAETWLLMNTLPQVFYQTFGRDITEEEFDALMKDGAATLIKIASLSIHTLGPLQTELKKTTDYPAKMKAGLERYEITVDESGQLEFSFQEEYLNRTQLWFHFKNQIKPRIPEPHHGCPVRDIRLSDNEGNLVSGIQAVVDFYTPLAKQIILPNQAMLRGSEK